MKTILWVLMLHSALWIGLRAETDIASRMDPSVDPCVDFYSFACGKYRKETKLTDDKAAIGISTEMSDRLNEQLRELLESPDQPTDARPASMTKRYYRSCMDEKTLEKLGVAPLAKLLKAFGGMPLLEGQNWTEAGYDWMTQTGRMYRELASSPIIGIGVTVDDKNASLKIVSIGQAGLTAGHRDYYLDKTHSKALAALRAYMTGSLIQLGATEKDAKDTVDEIIRFETDLANISMRAEDGRDADKLYNPMTVAAVKSSFPELPLDKWFAYMAQNGLALKDTDIIIVAEMPYVKQLGAVLKKYSARTIANYQLWQIVNSYVDYLGPSQRKPSIEYTKALTGTSKMPERWKECVGAANGAFGEALGAMYVKKHFPQSSKDEVDKMVTYVRSVMKSSIEQAGWMDQQTKSKALEKLEQMTQKTGYPEYIFNETRLMEGMEELDISADSYLANTCRMMKAAVADMLKDFHKPVNRSDWDATPATINAFYARQKNDIIFPAAYLQCPMFVSSAPHYQNYGRLGYVIGHEITHGYDDQGRQYDSKGNMASWWTNDTLNKFKQGAKCFIDQYSKIKNPVVGQNINGENTVGENIADNGGLRIAYKAYQMWKNSSMANGTATTDVEKPTEPELSKYSSDQLFFLAFSQTWCQVIRPEFLRLIMLNDDHSPNDARVNIPLKNFEAFAQAYKCPVGSPMNPKEKCSIW